MNRFKHHSIVIALIAIVVSSLIISALYRYSTISHLIDIEARIQLDLTRTISNSLLPRYKGYLEQAESMTKPQLETHYLSRTLHDDVAVMLHGLPVLKLNIFDTRNKILFSTDPRQIGVIESSDYSGSVVANTGTVISKISHHESFRKIDGSEVYDRSVLSSYLPIVHGSENRIVNVVEIYTDVTESMSKIERQQVYVLVILISILGLLYTALHLMVVRADRILIQQQREKEQATELSARLGRLLDKSSNEIYVFDSDSLLFTHVNQGACDNLGYSIEELHRMTPLDLKPELSQEEFLSVIEPLRSGKRDQVQFETVHLRKDGSTYPVSVQLQYSPAEDPPVFIAIILDITEKKKVDERLNYLAYYDSLTGLPNRSLFADRLEQAIREADRNELLVAVLFVDLDHFKQINDSQGHDAGDSLLQEAADRLRGCLRACDTVSRWGGDEFGLVLNNIKHVNDIHGVAEKIIARISEPFHINSKRHFISASIGIILYPLDDNNVENLLKCADAAMYAAKDSGRNNYKFYNHEMTAQLERRLEMESKLRKAIERDEFSLVYQPQVDIEKGNVVGIEALIRWHHPEEGMIPPDQFIGIAEDTGLIVQIGEWVLREACTQNRNLQNFGLAPINVSVNLSVRQLRESSLVEKVEQILHGTGLEPALLELEITESMLMIDVERIIQTLKDLSALGITISVDDFGTGHSSLAYLKQFPISTLKIDRAFIRDIPIDTDDTSITTAIISMAKGLRMKTVAEGVETAAQLKFLKKQECDLMQGYYFSRPVTIEEIVELLRREQSNAGVPRLDSAV